MASFDCCDDDDVHAHAGGGSAYKLEIRTVQSSTIKTLVEALKELLTDTVLEVDPGGIKIVATDMAHVVLVNLKLYADRFEYFHCPQELRIGINMLNLHKLIKTIGNSDTLTLYVEEDDDNHLGIKIESNEKNTKSIYKLDLLALPPQSIRVGPTEFDSVIVISATDFQKLCRDMHNIAETVEIRAVKNEVVFRCKGDFCSQETVLCNQGGADDGAVDHGCDITQGIFSLKYLLMFTRCTNLSNTVELFLKNDMPCILRYAVSTLGDIKLVCAPQLVD
jgi:proliferating cell nuclear antigen